MRLPHASVSVVYSYLMGKIPLRKPDCLIDLTYWFTLAGSYHPVNAIIRMLTSIHHSFAESYDDDAF